VIIETNSIDSLSISFYNTAALFTTLGAVTAILTKTTPRQAFHIFPIIIGIVIPLVAFAISQRISPLRKTTALVAALLATLAFGSIHYSVTPRPHTLSLPFLTISFLMLIRYFDHPLDRFFALLGLVGISMSLTHKLPLLVFIAGLSVTVGYSSLRSDSLKNNRMGWRLTGLGGCLLALQWLFVTDYLESVVEIGSGAITALLTGKTGIGASSSPTHAVPAAPQLFHVHYTTPNLCYI